MAINTVTIDKGQLIDEYLEALGACDEAGAMKIAKHMPLHPSLAKSMLRVLEKDTLMANCNLSEANERFGEN